MLGYGHDESTPTPGGMFATNFVGERWYFTECLLVSCGAFYHKQAYPITISRPFPPKYTSLPYTISYFAVISVILILLLTICV